MIAQLTDYCQHGEINDFIQKNHKQPKKYEKYRKTWGDLNANIPLFVLFETTSKCNLRCNMCVHSIGYEQTERMQDTTFKKALKEIEAMGVPSIAMNQVNEPLLDKNIFDKIALVSEIESVVDIHMNTNAVLLNRKNSERILNSNLTRLLLGFDGFTKNTFEKVRGRADYDQVLNNILKFLELKKEMKKVFPVTRISFVRTSENEHEVGAWFDFWKDKVDYISIQEFISPTVNDSKNHLIPKTSERTHVDPDSIICTQPSDRITIRGDGQVLPCCAHFAVKMPMGNVKTTGLEEIWNSDKFTKLRDDLMVPGGYKKHAICKKCIETSYGLNKTK